LTKDIYFFSHFHSDDDESARLQKLDGTSVAVLQAPR
jgi:hypothetical protein